MGEGAAAWGWQATLSLPHHAQSTCTPRHCSVVAAIASLTCTCWRTVKNQSMRLCRTSAPNGSCDDGTKGHFAAGGWRAGSCLSLVGAGELHLAQWIWFSLHSVIYTLANCSCSNVIPALWSFCTGINCTANKAPESCSSKVNLATDLALHILKSTYLFWAFQILVGQLTPDFQKCQLSRATTKIKVCQSFVNRAEISHVKLKENKVDGHLENIGFAHSETLLPHLQLLP